MDDYKQRVLGLYDKMVTPELGEGSLKQNLLSKLEMVLGVVPVHENKKTDLSALIDYKALKGICDVLGYTQTVGRVRNTFTERNIVTYGDLFAQYQKKKEEYKREDRDIDFKDYLGIYFKNMGKKSSEILLQHFELSGIEIPQ